MAEINQIYKCEVCGNIVEILHGGVGELVCCNQPMKLLEEKSQDEGQEKHVPVIEKTADGFKVKVGSIPHPMEEKHYVEWIELVANNQVYRQFLKPGSPAEAEFKVQAEQATARGYCNLHGLWKEKFR